MRAPHPLSQLSLLFLRLFRGDGGLPGPRRQTEPDAVEPFSEARGSSHQGRLRGLVLVMAVGPRGQTQVLWGQACGSNPIYSLTFWNLYFLICTIEIR